jgi:hypothetical protein
MSRMCYCLCCGLPVSGAIKGEGGYFHYRLASPRGDVVKCGPIDIVDENVSENRKEEIDESEIDV